MTWDLRNPLDIAGASSDRSGTPIALVELARRSENLVLLDEVEEAVVLVEFPFAPQWQRATGHARFVRLRTASPSDPKYALIRHTRHRVSRSSRLTDL
jgi:hypothetical protein